MLKNVTDPIDVATMNAIRHVLIVEDEPLIGMNLKACLEEAGARVVWVQTDHAAHIALNAPKASFDTLILDIDLGKGTTGFDIARYARSRLPDVGVIFSSGSPPDWLKAFGVEGAMFVPKPCNETALLAAFEMVGAAQSGSPTEVSETSGATGYGVGGKGRQHHARWATEQNFAVDIR